MFRVLKSIMCFLFLFDHAPVAAAPDRTPTVLVHGIASSKREMVELEDYLNARGVPTVNEEIGNGQLTSIFMPLEEQCALLAENIRRGSADGKRVNMVAISQGGLLARCYVEKYSHMSEYSGVDLLLTMGTPHMGVFFADDPDPFYKNVIRDYWKDPFRYQDYLRTNEFLSELNNEREHNESELYRSNMLGLKELGIVWTSVDEVVQPLESARFEYYNTTAAMERGELVVVPLGLSNTYVKDLIGLRGLDEAGRLVLVETDCAHDAFKREECFGGVIDRFFGFSAAAATS
jgi:palmitoyl-protein thioesterase